MIDLKELAIIHAHDIGISRGYPLSVKGALMKAYLLGAKAGLERAAEIVAKEKESERGWVGHYRRKESETTGALLATGGVTACIEIEKELRHEAEKLGEGK